MYTRDFTPRPRACFIAAVNITDFHNPVKEVYYYPEEGKNLLLG